MKDWQPALEVLKDMITDYLNFVIVCLTLAIVTNTPINGINDILLHQAVTPYLAVMLALRIIYGGGGRVMEWLKKQSLEQV